MAFEMPRGKTARRCRTLVRAPETPDRHAEADIDKGTVPGAVVLIARHGKSPALKRLATATGKPALR